MSGTYQIWYADNTSGAWSTPTRLTSATGGNDQGLPRIALDSSGKSHITWLGSHPTTGGALQIWYADNTSGAWPTPTQLTAATVGNDQWFPRIALDSSGKSHITWQGKDPTDGGPDQIWYADNTSGGWSTPTQLTAATGTNDQSIPQIAVDSSGKSHITWQGKHPTTGGAEQIWYRSAIGPTVTGLSPTSGTYDQSSCPVTVQGSHFQSGATLTLTGPDTMGPVATTGSGNTLNATLDLTGKATGSYKATVTNPDTLNGSKDDAFTVEAKQLGSTEWMVAEGSTGGGFDTYILMQNPGGEPAPTAVAFATEDGVQDGTLLTIPPRSRTSLRLSEYMPNEWGVSTTVAAEVPIVVERSMYWNGNETDRPYEMMGGHANLGLPAPMSEGFKMAASSDRSTDQFFPEGSTAGFDTWILLFNPNETEAQATVTLMEATGPVVTENVTIGPLSRKTVHLNKLLPNANEVATRVESDTFLVAERSIYWDTEASEKQPYQMIGGHSTSGSPIAANDWYIAEGSTAGGFETYVLVQNPSDGEALVTLIFSDDTGVANQASATMPAQSRSTFKLSDYVPDNFQVSTSINSDVPIVAERSMYWDKREATEPYAMKDGHSCMGETGAASTWMVSEGSTGGGFDTFVLVTNTENTEATATVTFMTENGPQAPFNITIPASSRYTLWENEYLPDTFQVSTLITSNNQLVVERSMYWDTRQTSADGNSPARPFECIGGHSANGLDP